MLLNKLIYILILVVGLNVLGAEPVKIIFDTDMGSDCDDVGALALLHAYADQHRVHILGCMYSSGKVPFGAGVVEAINIYYGRPHIPVGAYYGDDIGDPVDKMNAEKLITDRIRFGNTIVHNRDAQEMTALNRRLLAGQPDDSVTYVTVGHTKGLYDLFVSEPDAVSSLNGRELIKRKVTRWVALGALQARNEKGQYGKDWNFYFNGTAPYTGTLVKSFPKPIVYVTAGTDVMTGKTLVTTPSSSVVRTAYKEWLWHYSQKTLDDQRPSWDLAAVYFAVEGEGDFLTSAPNGSLEFDVEKGCRWIANKGPSTQMMVGQREGSSEAFARYLNHLIALPPGGSKH